MSKKKELYDQGHEVSICIGDLDNSLWEEMICFFERVIEREMETSIADEMLD